MKIKAPIVGISIQFQREDGEVLTLSSSADEQLFMHETEIFVTGVADIPDEIRDSVDDLDHLLDVIGGGTTVELRMRVITVAKL